MNQQEAEQGYWEALDSASSEDLKNYLELLNETQYFPDIHPVISKKLKACAAICLCEEEE